MEETELDPARAFLGSALEARIEAGRRSRKVEGLERRCRRVMNGHGKSTQSLWVSLIEERDREVKAVQDEIAKGKAVEEFVDSLDNPMDRSILRLRYLEGQNWVQVQQSLYAEGVYYTDRHITRLHKRALNAARRKMGYTE